MSSNVIFLLVGGALAMGAIVLGKPKQQAARVGFAVAAAVALGIAGMSMAGAFEGSSAAAAPAATAPGTGLFHDTQKVSVNVIDADGGAGLNAATVLFYKTGKTDKEIWEKTAPPEYQFTTDSAGAASRGGIPRMIYDARACVASYYCNIKRNLDPSVSIAQDTPEKTFPPFGLDKIGTFELDKSSATVSWTAGTTNDYTIFVQNTVADTKILLPAVKFESVKKGANSGASNMSISGCKSGCSVVNKAGTDYIVPDAKEIPENGVITMTVQVTYASGSADGAFKLTVDDLWELAGATTWNTNANLNGASTDTLTVTR